MCDVNPNHWKSRWTYFMSSFLKKTVGYNVPLFRDKALQITWTATLCNALCLTSQSKTLVFFFSSFLGFYFVVFNRSKFTASNEYNLRGIIDVCSNLKHRCFLQLQTTFWLFVTLKLFWKHLNFLQKLNEKPFRKSLTFLQNKGP